MKKYLETSNLELLQKKKETLELEEKIFKI